VRLDFRNMTQAVISRVKHGSLACTPEGGTQLFMGDIVKVVGTKDALQKAELMIGSKTEEDIPLAEAYEVSWILVTNKEVINKSLLALNLSAWYGATVTRIRRSGIDLSPQGSSTLRFGDKVLLACEKEGMRKVMKLLGNDEKRLKETDFLPISLGILIGLVFGDGTIPLLRLVRFLSRSYRGCSYRCNHTQQTGKNRSNNLVYVGKRQPAAPQTWASAVSGSRGHRCRRSYC
jgi:putative transport protein